MAKEICGAREREAMHTINNTRSHQPILCNKFRQIFICIYMDMYVSCVVGNGG